MPEYQSYDELPPSIRKRLAAEFRERPKPEVVRNCQDGIRARLRDRKLIENADEALSETDKVLGKQNCPDIVP